MTLTLTNVVKTLSDFYRYNFHNCTVACGFWLSTQNNSHPPASRAHNFHDCIVARKFRFCAIVQLWKSCAPKAGGTRGNSFFAWKVKTHVNGIILNLNVF